MLVIQAAEDNQEQSYASTALITEMEQREESSSL
jgi:hypothetical protein